MQNRSRFVFLLAVLIVMSLLIACTTASPTVTAGTPAALEPTPTSPPKVTETLSAPEPVTSITIFLIAGGDDGRSGTPVGCNDSAIPVQWDVEPTSDPVRTALEFLFSIEYQLVGPASLYNALYQSKLTVDQITVPESGPARIDLSGEVLMGGVCDQPRFEAQIEGTIQANADFEAFEVYINDKPLNFYLTHK